jgi:hypothetical protein
MWPIIRLFPSLEMASPDKEKGKRSKSLNLSTPLSALGILIVCAATSDGSSQGKLE